MSSDPILRPESALNHVSSHPVRKSSSGTSKVRKAIETSVYCPTAKTRSIIWRSSQYDLRLSHVVSLIFFSSNSSSAALIMSASSVPHLAFGPSLMRSISSWVRPASTPMSSCCAHSYSDWHNHPVRRIAISRSRAGIVDLNRTWFEKTSHRQARSGCWAKVRNIFQGRPASKIGSRTFLASLLSDETSSGGILGELILSPSLDSFLVLLKQQR